MLEMVGGSSARRRTGKLGGCPAAAAGDPGGRQDPGRRCSSSRMPARCAVREPREEEDGVSNTDRGDGNRNTVHPWFPPSVRSHFYGLDSIV